MWVNKYLVDTTETPMSLSELIDTESFGLYKWSTGNCLSQTTEHRILCHSTIIYRIY